MFKFVKWCFRDFVNGFIMLIVLLMICFLEYTEGEYLPLPQ